MNGAFNRRLALIEIGEIGEIIPDLENGLQKDIQSFIHLCVNALHETSGRGFCESANSIRHREELKKENDSVYSFLQDCTVRDPDRRVLRAELHRAYEDYCQENGWQAKSAHNFYEDLIKKGYRQTKISGLRYFSRLKLAEPEDTFADLNGQHTPFD